MISTNNNDINIMKIFLGIADNPVTTLVASALGQDKNVYIAQTHLISSL